jgi:cyclase
MTTTSRPGTLVELTRGVYARLHEGLTNAGIIVGDDSVLVIDSLRVPSYARELIADVRRVSDKPIQYLIDTHYHWDHSFGNQEFAGSTIIGHVNCRRELEELGEASRERVVAARNEWSDEVATVQIRLPDVTFDGRLTLYYGGRPVDLLYLGNAHTTGDIFIYLPEDKIVFTGDVAQDGGVPYMLDGHMRDWVETDTRLLDLDVERFGPCHGPVGEKPALVTARDFMAALVRETERAIADGRDEAGTRESVAAALQGEYGGWRGFDRLGDGVTRAYRQLRGTT